MPTLTTSRILRSVADNYHISVWKTDNTSTGSSANNQVTLPLESTGTYNFVVNWGDGTNNTITIYNQAGVTHTYENIGTYTIKIIGSCVGFRFNNGGDRLKILEIQRWGKNFELGNSSGYFYGCSNLVLSVNDKLNNKNIYNASLMFRDCVILNTGIFSIDTTNITNLTSFLFNCANFNQSVNGLNTVNVSNMSYMLYNCTSFNQDISSLSLKLVTNMTGILQGATSWSQANYDLFLIGAHAQALSTGIQDNVPFRCVPGYTAGGAAQAAHIYLESRGWIFNDGGPI